MSRESTIQAFVLKRQDYGETDQIITLLSSEHGKLRVLVKNAKSPVSRLQPALQPMFLVGLTLVGNSALKKIIRAQAVQTYAGIYAEPEKLSAWFVAAEMLLRSLADEQPSRELFVLLGEYLKFLDNSERVAGLLRVSALQFQLKTLEAIGLGVKSLQQHPVQDVWFDYHAGGFVSASQGAESFRFSPNQYQQLTSLLRDDFGKATTNPQDFQLLERAVSGFVSYQIERELKSSRHLMASA